MSAQPIGHSPLPPAPLVAEPWPPADATVVAYDVSRSFGGLVAVSNVSLAVRPGVTALLGPNGAGKSTLLRMLSGQIATGGGKVWVAGGDPRTDADARGRIGLVPQQDGVFEREKGFDVVKLAATLSNVDDPAGRAHWALGLVELDTDLERPMGSYSKGMRQRVKIAQALVHDPVVIMLDEPLNGLDPKQRRQMIGLFHRLGEMGKTVLVSSHVLEEVERFGSHVIVIARGRMAAQGDFRAIRALMDDQPLRIRVVCEKASQLAATLVNSGSLVGCTVEAPNQVEVVTNDVRRFRREVALVCSDQGLRLEEITPLDEDLESVFRYLVGGGA
ncbi:MAG: ABC-2 type transport system ATP-binding protein [Acidimicrobiales bacterium]|jgi:ABC-2 type transport system ATP-binding protein